MSAQSAVDRGRRRRNSGLIAGLVALDCGAVFTAMALSDRARVALEYALGIVPATNEHHVIASALVLPVMLALFWLGGLYDPDRILVGTREYADLAHATTYGVFAVITVSFAAGHVPFISRLWVILIWSLTLGFTACGRFAARRIVRGWRGRGAQRVRVVVVGASSLGITVARELRAASGEGLEVVGFLDEYVPIGQRLFDDVAVIGRPEDLLDRPTEELADEFVLVPPALPAERLAEIARLMASRGGPIVRMVVGTNDLLTNGVVVASRGSIPLVTLRRARIAGLDAVLKRAMDLTVALVALVPLAALTGLAALRAWILGGAVAFERTEVRGPDGRTICLWLLDRRVAASPLARGAPTLLAVLRGHLSLVGPRPVNVGTRGPTTFELAQVQPGLTGPWRIQDAAGSFAEQTLSDLAYVRHYSIWEDLRILGETIRRLVPGLSTPVLRRWSDGTGSAGSAREPAPEFDGALRVAP